MSVVDEGAGGEPALGEWEAQAARVRSRADDMALSAGAFAGAITRAFAQATAGGRQLDEVLKSLALRLSNLTVQAALKPLARDIAGGIDGIVRMLGGSASAAGQGGPALISPFADGGVIRTPRYFPLESGLGLAGEGGPEAILPLARASDGRLGVALAGAAPAAANVSVQIATPDLGSFRRSEAYLTGQIARAVARGQRGL